jgi:hypothetical protein
MKVRIPKFLRHEITTADIAYVETEQQALEKAVRDFTLGKITRAEYEAKRDSAGMRVNFRRASSTLNMP